jgi:hypothetical protein
MAQGDVAMKAFEHAPRTEGVMVVVMVYTPSTFFVKCGAAGYSMLSGRYCGVVFVSCDAKACCGASSVCL